MKKLFTVLITLFLISSCFATQASAAVELELCYWPVEQIDEIEEAIEHFNKSQNEIHVNANVIPYGQYFNKLSMSMPAGAAPDILLVNVINEIDYTRKGYLLDISDLFESGAIDLSKFPDFVLKIHTIDGKLRCVPKDYDSIAVFYNKELFDNAGVPYPKSGWTWDEFVETAKKITDPSKKIYGAGLPPDTQTVLFDFIYQCGGDIFDDDGICCINTPESAEALHKIYDAITIDKISPTVDEFAEVGCDVMFQSGTLAMCLNGSWNMNQFQEVLDDQLGVVSLPNMKNFKTIVDTIGWIIPKSTKHPEEAKKVLAYLGSKEAQDIMSGSAISAYKGSEKVWTEKYKKYDAHVFTDSITDDSVVPYPISNKESFQVSNILSNRLTEIIATGEIEERLMQMENEINALLV